MRKIFFALVAVILFVFQTAQAQPSPQWVKNLLTAQKVEQVIIVAGVRGSTAWISMHEKNPDGSWREIMTTPGFIGKEGLDKVREGDNKTPSGTFNFDFAFGIAPDPGCAFPYVQVNEHHYWSSDNNYKYNQFVDDRETPDSFDKTVSEHLIDFKPNYNYCLNFDYNSGGTPDKGSALFMQCFGDTKPWTGGSVAIPEEKMLFVMQHIKQGCICIIDSLETLGGSL